MVFIGINLGLSGGLVLLTGALALLALLMLAALRTMAQRHEPRLVPVRIRSRRHPAVRPGAEFLASTPSRAPPPAAPFASRRQYDDDDLGNPPLIG